MYDRYPYSIRSLRKIPPPPPRSATFFLQAWRGNNDMQCNPPPPEKNPDRTPLQELDVLEKKPENKTCLKNTVLICMNTNYLRSNKMCMLDRQERIPLLFVICVFE